jgi:hypothetical protein
VTRDALAARRLFAPSPRGCARRSSRAPHGEIVAMMFSTCARSPCACRRPRRR